MSRRVRDLSCGDTRVVLDLEIRRVDCVRCGKVKRERLAFLADNPFYTKRFAFYCKPFLTRTRWLLLKRPENLTPKQEIGLAELLLRSNLRAVRAYLLKEDLQRFWSYVSPYWAGVFLERWCTRVMRSRIEPMKKVARMLRSHRELILRGSQRQGACHHETSLRIPHVPRRRSRPVSQPWSPTRTGHHPQILLRNRILCGSS
jgi:transposase